MTNDELNRAVAAAMGLSPTTDAETGETLCRRGMATMPGYATVFKLPDFCNDARAAELVIQDIRRRDGLVVTRKSKREPQDMNRLNLDVRDGRVRSVERG
jgi:hypothetical protein